MTPKQEKQIEKDLLSKGTSGGPVTAEMIAYAKKRYQVVCEYAGYVPEVGGWIDFVIAARRQIFGSKPRKD